MVSRMGGPLTVPRPSGSSSVTQSPFGLDLCSVSRARMQRFWSPTWGQPTSQYLCSSSALWDQGNESPIRLETAHLSLLIPYLHPAPLIPSCHLTVPSPCNRQSNSFQVSIRSCTPYTLLTYNKLHSYYRGPERSIWSDIRPPSLLPFMTNLSTLPGSLTLASLLFFQQGKHTPTSGPLHRHSCYSVHFEFCPPEFTCYCIAASGDFLLTLSEIASNPWPLFPLAAVSFLSTALLTTWHFI